MKMEDKKNLLLCLASLALVPLWCLSCWICFVIILP